MITYDGDGWLTNSRKCWKRKNKDPACVGWGLGFFDDASVGTVILSASTRECCWGWKGKPWQTMPISTKIRCKSPPTSSLCGFFCFCSLVSQASPTPPLAFLQQVFSMVRAAVTQAFWRAARLTSGVELPLPKDLGASASHGKLEHQSL